jgi:hypothetical protein
MQWGRYPPTHLNNWANKVSNQKGQKGSDKKLLLDFQMGGTARWLTTLHMCNLHKSRTPNIDPITIPNAAVPPL